MNWRYIYWTTQGPVHSPLLVVTVRRLELREACCLGFFWNTNLLFSLLFGDASSMTSSLLLRFAGFLEIISVATAFERHHQESRWRSRPMMIAMNSVSSWSPVLMVLLRLPCFVPEVDDKKNDEFIWNCRTGRRACRRPFKQYKIQYTRHASLMEFVICFYFSHNFTAGND